MLTLSDSVHAAQLTFDGTYQLANFKFVHDGQGGTTVYDPPVSSDTDLLSAHTHTTDTVVTNGGTLLNDAVAAFKGASRSRSRSKSGTLSMGTTTGTGTRSGPPLRIRLRRRCEVGTRRRAFHD
ncbi:MAG: hypothetical protein ABWZ64_08040 [Xanthobacteraceae bacterium]